MSPKPEETTRHCTFFLVIESLRGSNVFIFGRNVLECPGLGVIKLFYIGPEARALYDKEPLLYLLCHCCTKATIDDT